MVKRYCCFFFVCCFLAKLFQTPLSAVPLIHKSYPQNSRLADEIFSGFLSLLEKKKKNILFVEQQSCRKDIFLI